eukprot:TRINITY_DN7496_c0_g1_i1.p1 TRINITY_DN7496_c0_g1~~TRINITY_DN7496_c0_g1_i1.p1  ORF type:complete len:335 (-),score=74.90 TRINITY_DN7496_c0_g1_i1:176-1180(-)
MGDISVGSDETSTTTTEPLLHKHLSLSEHASRFTKEYMFYGKLTLFPLAIGFLTGASGTLMVKGKYPGSDSGQYIGSAGLYYAVSGLGFALLALGLFFCLLRYMVIRICFTISKNKFVIEKKGLIRTSRLEFSTSQSSLLYYRTNFSDFWLQLVVKERDQYYQIFSWKGRGQQKERFLKLFQTLSDELAKFQKQSRSRRRIEQLTEIISKKELILISPFSGRINNMKARVEYSLSHTTPPPPIPPSLSTSLNLGMSSSGQHHSLAATASSRDFERVTSTQEIPRTDLDTQQQQSQPTLTTPKKIRRTICIEHIPVTNYDTFFSHFEHQKLIPQK